MIHQYLLHSLHPRRKSIQRRRPRSLLHRLRLPNIKPIAARTCTTTTKPLSLPSLLCLPLFQHSLHQLQPIQHSHPHPLLYPPRLRQRRSQKFGVCICRKCWGSVVEGRIQTYRNITKSHRDQFLCLYLCFLCQSKGVILDRRDPLPDSLVLLVEGTLMRLVFSLPFFRFCSRI